MLPGALSIGIPFETFWKLNPLTIKAHQKAYEAKLKADTRMMDSQAWLQGRYTLYAVAACLSKNVRYPKEPFGTEPQVRYDEYGNEVQPLKHSDRFRMYAEEWNNRNRPKKKKVK